MNEVHEILEELVKDDYYVTTNNGTKCKIVSIDVFDKIKENFEKLEQNYIREHTTTIHGYTEEYVKKLQQENKQLKEQLDISETNYEIIYGYFTQISELLEEEICEGMLDKIIKFKNQLKQRKEVIDEAIKYVLEHTIDMSVEGDKSDLMFEKANGYELLEILQKYKGDNNE